MEKSLLCTQFLNELNILWGYSCGSKTLVPGGSHEMSMQPRMGTTSPVWSLSPLVWNTTMSAWLSSAREMDFSSSVGSIRSSESRK